MATFKDLKVIVTDAKSILEDVKNTVKGIKDTAHAVRHPLDTTGSWIGNKVYDMAPKMGESVSNLFEKMGNLFSDTDIKQPQGNIQGTTPIVTPIQEPLVLQKQKNKEGEATLANLDILSALKKSNELLEKISNIKKDNTPRGPFRVS